LRSSKRGLAVLVVCFSVASAWAQPAAVKLWPKGAPGAMGITTPESVRVTPQGDHVISNVQEPSILPYLPPAGEATGAAVVIAPGGGHSELWMDHEGYNIAAWLSSHGVAAFVVKYRLAREKGSTYTVEGTALGDMQRAVRMVRSRSAEWGVNPERIGVMGFSAGGELAALAATRYDGGAAGSDDPVERVSDKPNFQALIYPAIPHETRLTAETPRAFLACGGNDRVNIAQGLPELYLEMAKLHVTAELHVFAGVGHGFGVRKTTTGEVAGWPDLFLAWMKGQGLLTH
jgi:dienelactone hydrolase